jgi:hypothetical protein
MNHQTEQHPVTLDDIFSVEALAASAPNALTVETLRWQLRHREVNGLSSACVRIGKKLLISKSRYEQWLGSRMGAAA